MPPFHDSAQLRLQLVVPGSAVFCKQKTAETLSSVHLVTRLLVGVERQEAKAPPRCRAVHAERRARRRHEHLQAAGYLYDTK